jgi:hypothetical protein
MAHITHRPEVASPHRRPGFVMAILVAAALAVLGLSVLTWPADRIAAPSLHPSLQGADAVADTAATPQREDWHGNYNMVRR